MIKSRVGIIGFGNMGKAMTQGLLAKKVVNSEQIIVSDTTLPVSEENIICTTDTIELVQKAEVIILAVKPQIMDSVLEEIQNKIREEQVIISIAAGITIKNLQQRLSLHQSIIRAMPNLNAKIGESMTAWVCSDKVSEDQKNIAKEIFQAIEKEVYLHNEDMINAFTAIAGSGPAYVFYLAELMQKAAVECNFSQEDAKQIVYQTVLGSVLTLLQSNDSPEVLRQQVTSKGGITEAAFTEFAKNNLEKIFIDGIKKAKERAEELVM